MDNRAIKGWLLRYRGPLRFAMQTGRDDELVAEQCLPRLQRELPTWGVSPTGSFSDLAIEFDFGEEIEFDGVFVQVLLDPRTRNEFISWIRGVDHAEICEFVKAIRTVGNEAWV